MTEFVITEATPVVKVSKYADAVDALINAGEGKALQITVPRGIKRDGTPVEEGKGGGKDRIAFQQAANEKGYTARARTVSEDLDAQTATIEFTLTELHKRGSHKPAEELAEAPAEAVAEVAAEEAPAEVAEFVAEEAPAERRRGFGRG